MDTNNMTWSEAVSFMRTFNNEHGIRVKGDKPEARVSIVAVISQDSFTKSYTEEQRSYGFDNSNKAVLPNMLSNSIFAECLDKSEYIKLSDYVPERWKVERCYIV